MNTAHYERPREKLQQKGIAGLSTFELLQIIIGSGTASLPVTKIARKLYKVLNEKGEAISFNDLTAIAGVGQVKAGQIIAGLELAYRLSNVRYEDLADKNVTFDTYGDLRTAKNQTLMYAFLNGRDEVIYESSLVLKPQTNLVKVVRSLFSEALSSATASVSIALGYKSQPLEAGIVELDLMRNIYSTAKLLSLRVNSFVLVNANEIHNVKEINYE